MFRPSECIIPEIWCGDSATFPKTKGRKYYKVGSRVECLRKGFGAGSFQARKAYLPPTSLQQIKYIGEVHEKSFKKAGISSTLILQREARGKSVKNFEALLRRILTKKDGALDARAYNSVLMYLYQHGNSSIPRCRKL